MAVHRQFPSTSWSAILLARESAPEAAQAGLDRLCRKYWPPILTFIQRHGHDAVAAQDLAQEFFMKALAKSLFQSADPARGSLRALLAISVKRFLIDKSREPFLPTVRLPDGDAALLPDHSTSEREFDRSWAETLLNRCLTELERDYARRGRLELFLRLQPCLLDRGRLDMSYAAIAAKFGLTEDAVKAEVYRMRQRFCHLIREEISGTVTTSAEVEEELRHLFRAFAG